MVKNMLYKKRNIGIAVVTCLVVSCAKMAFAAGLGLSVAGGHWAIGTIGSAIVATSGAQGSSYDKWTVTGSTDGEEDVYIKVDGTTSHPAASPGENLFVLKHDASGSWGSAITNTGNGILLKQYLVRAGAAPGTQKFDLQFTAPTTGNAGVEQTLTVTLTATNWYQANRVFVTSTTYTGAMGDVPGGDSLCQTRANAASLGGSWRAWLSSSNYGNAANRIVDRAYYLVDRLTKVCNSKADLLDGSILVPINKTESGGSAGGSYVWTGTNSDGSYSTNNACQTVWSTTSTSYYGYCGNHGSTNSSWTYWTTLRCDDAGNGHLYCFEN